MDAIQSSIEIQGTLKTKNEKLPDNRRMDFRIGINLGDIIHKDDRIYGDGVNIAARIESLTDPGGICISRGVFDQVDGKLEIGFADLGPHSVKNIKKPVNIFKVLLEWIWRGVPFKWIRTIRLATRRSADSPTTGALDYATMP